VEATGFCGLQASNYLSPEAITDHFCKNPVFPQIVPKSMLFGHDSAVNVLTNCADSVEAQVILSASASGYVIIISESKAYLYSIHTQASFVMERR
jgi:hypothetical protein